MRKVTIFVHMSLDSVIQPPGVVWASTTLTTVLLEQGLDRPLTPLRT